MAHRRTARLDQGARDQRQLAYQCTVALVALAAVAGYAVSHLVAMNVSHTPVPPVVRSDGEGYYSYLPAYLLQRDPTFRTWVATELPAQYPGALHLQPRTNRYLEQYPVGEALMILPFFAGGHLAAQLSGARADGYSPMETGAAGLAGLTYMVLGLFLLGRSLRRYFSPLIASAVLLSITFGTDLFSYGTFDSIFSHAFSFFLLAAFIELLHRWAGRPATWRIVLGIGVVMGLICEVRQTNAIILLLVPLFGVATWPDFRRRIGFFWAQRRRVAAMIAAAALTFAPQLLIWHEATGHWITNSYPTKSGTFHFGAPQLIRTLFSFHPHGLIPWGPIAALAVIGLVPMRNKVRPLFLTAVVILALYVYVVASWTYWYGAGGYGDRFFIDVFPLLAFALGSLYAAVAASWPGRLLVGSASFVCCGAVLIQMANYWEGRLPIDGASFNHYVDLLRHGL
jgi:hypothetical protein